MSLQLNVPALEEKPGVLADMRPKHIQDMIASLPHSNPRAAARLLLDELERLNRQQAGVDQRLTALELYRPAVLNAVTELSKQYCNQTLPLQETAKSQAELAQHLFTELAYGYKHAILAEEDKLFALGNDDQLALLLQRAIDSLGRLLHVHYLTYVATPEGTWKELHALYLHTVQLALQNLTVPDIANESSINSAYKHTLLLALTNPAHLNSIDINRVIEYLDHHAHIGQLHPLGGLETKAGIFLVNLKSDTAPVPFTKITGNTDARSDILLITIELARLVHHHLHQLQANESPAQLNLPEDAGFDPRYRDLLVHLLKHWGNPPKRVFHRSETTSAVRMCVGMPAILHFLGKQSSPRKSTAGAIGVTLSFANSMLDTSSGAIYRSAQWMVVNESPGGLALSKSASPTLDALRIGELLGLKPEHASHWEIAAVRWASNGDGDGDALQIGAQMIAPNAQVVSLELDHPTHSENALLLPELAALKQPASLIAARGTYKPARSVRLLENGQPVEVLLTRLIERTSSFERFQFSRL